MLKQMLETEWRWRFVENYCWGFGQEQGDWNFVGHQAVPLGGGLGLGWWAELCSLDQEELVEAREGRGVVKELKRARLIGKMVGFGKVGLVLVLV